MNNMPELKIGVVAVSRDCFPESLSVNRRKALIDAYTKKYGEGTVYECPICIVESEIHMVQALEDVKKIQLPERSIHAQTASLLFTTL